MDGVTTRKLNGGLLVLLGMAASCGPRVSQDKMATSDISATASAQVITSTVAANDDKTVSYGLSADGSRRFFRVYVDTDRSRDTGFARAGIGADYLVENRSLYRYNGTGREWAWRFVNAVDYTNANLTVSWTIARADLGETDPCTETADLVFDVDDTVAPVLAHRYTTSDDACAGTPADAGAPSADAGAPSTTGTPASDGGAGEAVAPDAGAPAGNHINYVFVIAMENESAAAIYGNSHAPYINNVLLPRYGRANAFSDPLPDATPSEPHYVWMEAGTNRFADTTFTDDSDPSESNSTASTAHLVTQMQAANPAVSWLSFQEGLNASTGACPVRSSGFYGAKHNPFVFFRDVAGSPPSPTNSLCAEHHRAYTPATFADALSHGAVARYNFITPDACHDMHGAAGCPSSDNIAAGDSWLASNLPPLIDFVSSHSGVIFIVWDEPVGGSTLIPFLAIGPHVKPNYANQVPYTHSSLAKSLEEIFRLPILPTVAAANDLRDLFEPGFFP
jgi:hypothetical protein